MSTSFTLLLTICIAFLSATANADAIGAGIDRLNRMRRAAGLPALVSSPRLEAAARAHAAYLRRHRENGHDESPSRPGFSGVSPSDRAAAAGFPAREVGENLSYGQPDIDVSLDALMTGIYHRFGFLDPAIDAVGIATEGREDMPRYVYELGNHRLAKACASAPSAASGAYYTGVCNPDRRLPASTYLGARDATLSTAPALIVWPPSEATDAQPAFYNETPDPLPDREISGNPISVWFNPYWIEQVQVLAFDLYDAKGRRLAETRLLDSGNDPNGHLTDHQFALFPLRRLAWNAEYRAELRYRADGVTKTHRWRFRTRAPENLRVLEINGDRQRLRVASGSRFAIHLTDNTERSGTLTWLANRAANRADLVEDIHFIDPATLAVTLGDAPSGARALLTLGNGQRLSIETIDGEPLRPLPAPAANGCAAAPATARFDAASGRLQLPGVRLDGDARFDATLQLIVGDPRVAFEVTALTPARTPANCVGATFDSPNGRLEIPRIDAPGLGRYRATLRLVEAREGARLILSELEAL